ncbi:MAG: hypothetical protein LBD01_06860 [Puniceicoccales bacterium]|nr:hypothetical protein [Puniceicoccales bacterium]
MREWLRRWRAGDHTLAITHMIKHLKIHGVDLKHVEVRTGLGTEFDGDTVHYRPKVFCSAIATMGAYHHFSPPARPNCNVGVESVHATIENEFFDLENFSGRAHVMAAAGTYQHYHNFARKNRSRANKTSVELLREKAPNLYPRILLLRPCLLDAHMGQLLSRPPVFPQSHTNALDIPPLLPTSVPFPCTLRT